MPNITKISISLSICANGLKQRGNWFCENKKQEPRQKQTVSSFPAAARQMPRHGLMVKWENGGEASSIKYFLNHVLYNIGKKVVLISAMLWELRTCTSHPPPHCNLQTCIFYLHILFDFDVQNVILFNFVLCHHTSKKPSPATANHKQYAICNLEVLLEFWKWHFFRFLWWKYEVFLFVIICRWH